ncbi:MAG: glycosyltransferase [Candidatus Doudnabacteria bacterium]|nr:glycosyltransferase [Candidatus Doudnabacteria bacterium]
MIRVLQVCKTFKEVEGGIERVVDALAFSYSKTNEIRSSVITTTIKQEQKEDLLYGEKVYFFPRNFTIASSPFSFSFFRNFKKIAKDYDVIHYHFPWPFMDITHLLTAVKKPTVISYQSDIVRQKFFKSLYSPIMHAFFKKADIITTSSQNLLDSSPALRNYKQKTIVIPIGLETEQYPEPSQERMSFWTEKLLNLGIKNEEPFLFIGTLRYYKGLEYLIKAVDGTNLKLLIIGEGLNRGFFEQMSKGKNVYFLGHVNEEDKVALIRLCRAVVSPAHLRSEAFCISLLEGLMYSKPLISTELRTGTSFVNYSGFTGLVVSPKDVMALRDAMQKLATDKDLYDRYKANTKTHYERHFRGHKVAQAFGDVYKKLLVNQKK